MRLDYPEAQCCSDVRPGSAALGIESSTQTVATVRYTANPTVSLTSTMSLSEIV